MTKAFSWMDPLKAHERKEMDRCLDQRLCAGEEVKRVLIQTTSNGSKEMTR